MTTNLADAGRDPRVGPAERTHSPTFVDGVAQKRLVARLRAGEAGALEELYFAYKKPIFGFLVRLTRDQHAAEDLFQNTWLKVGRSVGRLRDDTELKAWLFTVARNEFRSYRRWQMIDISRLFLMHRERTEPSWQTAPDADGDRSLAEVERGLGRLGPSDREVLLLVCVEGMAPQQASTVLGISHAALRQRLGRARDRLRAAMSHAASRAPESPTSQVRGR